MGEKFSQIEAVNLDNHNKEELSPEKENSQDKREKLSIKKFKELEGIAWKTLEIPPENLRDGWKYFEKDLAFSGDNKIKKSWFAYDPTRIEIDYLLLDNIRKDGADAEFRKEKIKEVNDKYKAWTQIDDDRFARPFLKELNFPLEKGFYLGVGNSIGDKSKMVDFIQKETLRVYLKRIPLVILNYIENYFPDSSDTARKMINDPDNVLHIDRIRVDNIDSQEKPTEILPHSIEEAAGKNPDFIKKYSKPSFKRETCDIFKQLRSMGYRIILSNPGDDRRHRVYLKLGMKEIAADDTRDFLYYDLDNLEK